MLIAVHHPDRQAQERAQYIEILAKRLVSRTGLPMQTARRIVRAVAVSARPARNAYGDPLSLHARQGRIARYG
jgi:hypothetical protein